ncbi:Hypothetical predicted protein [Lecanosticta acicola]|uniref:F-box domain-containing protein n=1 Tax=Lecanosticta acicola TaxID=111012 RepID=A0AAI9E896_9PEZI|nr:Hypothetical predicted protein [Lecanosticta acicola]
MDSNFGLPNSVQSTWRNYDRPNEYWKFHLPSFIHLSMKQMKQMMDDLGVSYPKSGNKEQITRALFRAQLGLTQYHNCSNTQLRKFIHDRKIDASGVIGGKFIGNHRELVSLLERADEHPQFHKFMDLPAELRNRVYEYHFSDMRTAYAPAQPPISRASRVLRQESLSMFYSICIFNISFNVSRIRSRHGDSFGAPLWIPDKHALWLGATPEKHLSQIMHLEIRVIWGMNTLHTFSFDITKGAVKSITVDHNFADASANAKLRSLFDLLLTSISTRKEDGEPKLSRDDIYAFRRAIEKGLG